MLAATGIVAGGAKRAKAVEPPEVPPSMKVPGTGMGDYGSPAKYESKVTRTLIRSQPGTTGSGASRTPLESLEGMVTPSGLHFERHHSGVPAIDPGKHRLVGGQRTLASRAPVRTIGSYWPYATTVFDYVRRSMPYTQPQSLSDDEVYAVTAYLLNLNGIIGDNDEMNAHTLPKVKMPNQPSFIIVYPSRGK